MYSHKHLKDTQHIHNLFFIQTMFLNCVLFEVQSQPVIYWHFFLINFVSGIKVLVKCDKVKKLAMATTEDDGSFEADVPSDYKTPPTVPLNCLAKLLGGPNQLYASKKIMISQIVETHHSNTYTIKNPLSFSQSCPSTISHAKCEAIKNWTSSKTVDLPLPPQWGLAPSYYIPFFPIIGIPWLSRNIYI